jgi:hypothetical protein
MLMMLASTSPEEMERHRAAYCGFSAETHHSMVASALLGP